MTILHYTKFLLKWIRYFAGTAYGSIAYPMKSLTVRGYRNSFCGYYDLSPFNPIDSNLIVIHANNHSPSKRPRCNSITKIFVVNREDQRVLFDIGSTRAWNWQQGARAFWLNERKVVYNLVVDGILRSVVVDYATSASSILPFPVEHAVGDLAVSLDFDALSTNRPDYGYNTDASVPAHLTRRIILWRIGGDAQTEICSVDRALSAVGMRDHGCPTWLNHALISPNGKRIVFLLRHRCRKEVYHHLLLYDVIQGELTVLLKDRFVSHYAWLNDDSLIIWQAGYSGRGYYVIELEDGFREVQVLPSGDGHPTLVRPNLVLVDSYPDLRMRRTLRLVHLNDTNVATPKPFFSVSETPYLTQEVRTDPHPSVSGDKRFFQIDTRIKGNRQAMIGELPSSQVCP